MPTVFYTDHFPLPLPPAHRFPIEKYELVRLALIHEGILEECDARPAPQATSEDLAHAHSREYVHAVLAGRLSRQQIRKIGFPWSPELVERSLASVGGTLAAVQEALHHGISGNLAGGTHHASSDEGEGFCVFNDQAVAAAQVLTRGDVKRVAIIDLDVHQGNGTSAILGKDERVYIFSMHGANNYPSLKIPSSLDVGLPDGTTDDDYLDILEACLPKVMAFKPDVVLYQAGVDPLGTDRLGKLALTHDGLVKRDDMVLRSVHAAGIPVALALGGGYGVPISETIKAHVGTYKVVREVYG